MDALTPINLPKKRGNRGLLTIAAPKNYKESQMRTDKDKWKAAYETELKRMKEVAEIEAIDQQQVPQGAQLIPIKQIMSTKFDNVKKKEIYKARFVVRGDLQEQVPSKTYAPVATNEAIKLLLMKIVNDDLKVRQADVSTAFLYGREDQEVYLELPDGHPKAKEGAWKSHASVYGLKSAPLTWYRTLTSYLKEKGFSACRSDTCLMKNDYLKETVYLVIYVDDLLYASKSTDSLKEFEKELLAKFNVKTTGKLEDYVGMHLKMSPGMIELDQKSKIEKLSSEIGSQELKPAKVPLCTTDYEAESPPLNKTGIKEYQSLVGQLLYINLGTRPDITFAVNILSRFLKSPTVYQLKLAKQVCRYLHHTKEIKMVYKKSNAHTKTVIGYVDATYQSEKDLKSVYGFVVKVAGSIIKFRTKKLNLRTESTCETEYMGMYYVSKETRYIVKLLDFLQVKYTVPKIMCDNRSAVNIAVSRESIERTKHIKSKYLIVQDLVEEKEVEPRFLPGAKQIADLLTKPLNKNKFVELRDMLYSGESVAVDEA